MNLKKLNNAIEKNKTLLSSEIPISLNVDGLPLSEQIKALEYFKQGNLELMLMFPSKKTSPFTVHAILKKDNLSINVGAVSLPALKELKKDALTSLFLEVFRGTKIYRPTENLNRNNRSLLVYTLGMMKESSYSLVKGPLDGVKEFPKEYDSVGKVLAAMDLAQYQKEMAKHISLPA